MRATYDREVNAAYIRLKNAVAPGESKAQYVCRTAGQGSAPGVEIILDFDADGRLIGIEVLHASLGLPQELLEQADIIA